MHTALDRLANTSTQRMIHMKTAPAHTAGLPAIHRLHRCSHGKDALTLLHTAASQLPNHQLTNASLCAYIRPPPASNGHPDTHHINAPPRIPLPVPSSMLGLVRARNHPPRQPTTPLLLSPAQFSAKRIWAPSPLAAPCGQR